MIGTRWPPLLVCACGVCVCVFCVSCLCVCVCACVCVSCLCVVFVFDNRLPSLFGSDHNPYFFAGAVGAGIGSPHTLPPRIWPMAVVVRALTATGPGRVDEVRECLRTLWRMQAGTGVMHESVMPDNPIDYTRAWFAWVCSIAGEMMAGLATDGPSVRCCGVAFLHALPRGFPLRILKR